MFEYFAGRTRYDVNNSRELKYVKYNPLKEWHPFVYHDNTWSMEIALYPCRVFCDNETRVFRN